MARTVRQLTDLLAEGRSTGGSRVGTGGVIEQAAAGVARVDAGKGLLVEGQRTNLLLRSAEFDNSAWAKAGSTVTANAVVAPDGTLTADKLIENTATSYHGLIQVTPFVSGTPYTVSVFAKAGERSIVGIQASSWSNPNDRGLNFNLATGVVSLAYNGAVASDGTITHVGGGWYRCTATFVSDTTSSGLGILFLAKAVNDTAPHTGDGTSGIFIWGAQLEAGEFPTSYIPTTSAQVTRTADRPTLAPAASLSAWQTEKATWIVDVRDACQLDELLSFNGHALLRGVSGSGRVVLAKTSQFTGRVYVDGVFAYEITPEMGVDMNAVGTLLLATGGQAWLRDLKCRPYAMTDTEIANLEVV